MPAAKENKLVLNDIPKPPTPACVGDLSLHASKKTAYQSDSGSSRDQRANFVEL
jgi:hypothetical protein